jgi:hypothetical protein
MAQFMRFLTTIFDIMSTYSFVRLALSHETRPKKLTNHLREQMPKSFWSAIFVPKVLPKNWAALASLSIYAPLSTQQSVYNDRRNAGTDLPDCLGTRANLPLS